MFSFSSNTTPDTVPIWLRYLLEYDLGAVMAIERASSPCPRTQAEFVAWLRPESRIGLVAGTRNAVQGYIIYEPNFHRLDLLDFVVAPACRAQGLGHQMMGRMVERLDESRRTHLGIVVNERNVGGQLFLRHEGFRFVEVLRGGYPAVGAGPGSLGDDEDGYRFLRGRGDTDPVPLVRQGGTP